MIGEKIRKARKAKNITLSELATASDLTASYISQVERDLTEPSLSSLRKIAAALKSPLYSFLDSENSQTQVIRSDKRKKLTLTDSNIIYEFLSPTGPSVKETPMLEVVLFRLNPKSWSREDYSSHMAEECIIVMSGVMVIDCQEDTYKLYEGDSVYIGRNAPHRAYNPGEEVATALLCITPPVH